MFHDNEKRFHSLLIRFKDNYFMIVDKVDVKICQFLFSHTI